MEMALPLSVVCLMTVMSLVSGYGYYTATTYRGVTCGYTEGREDAVHLQSGYRFGACIVGYDSNGIPVSSAIYTSDCEIVGDEYQAMYTLYSDLNCQSDVLYHGSYNMDAICSTTGNVTISYACNTDQDQPPYTSLSSGYITGLSSTYDECTSEIPVSYTWSRVKTCETDSITSGELTCKSDTSSTREIYYDADCTFSEQRMTSEFVECVIEYDPAATDRDPSFENFRYGICQSSSHSSSSDDDEVSLSQLQYGGEVSGSVVGGVVLGIIATGVTMVVFCHCRPGKGDGDGDEKAQCAAGSDSDGQCVGK